MVIPCVIGQLVPAHCTALGKILSPQPGGYRGGAWPGPLSAPTARTLTEPEVIRRELDGVRARGYAVDWEEFHEGNVCVAAPVRNYRGQVVAAISVSLVKTRLLVREEIVIR